MFDRELDFYGLDTYAGEGIVNDLSITRMANQTRQELHLAKSKHDMFLLAMEAHYQYNMKKTVTSNTVQVVIDTTNHKLYDVARKNIDHQERILFLNFLDKFFGLELDKLNGQVSRRGIGFAVCTKEYSRKNDDQPQA